MRLILAILAVLCTATAVTIPAPSFVVGTPVRPAPVFVPPTYNGHKTPLLVLLHGFSSDPLILPALFASSAFANGFIMVAPTGTRNPQQQLFWDATVCCNFFNQPVNDFSYLKQVIAQVSQHVRIDKRRIYLLGVSNGAMFAMEFACKHSELIAAVVSVSGTLPLRSTCKPKTPVSILHAHGTNDQTVFFNGRQAFPQINVVYTSARETVARWSHWNRCSCRTKVGARFTTDALQPYGAVPISFKCPKHARVEFWKLNQSGHVPSPTLESIQRTMRFLRKSKKAYSFTLH